MKLWGYLRSACPCAAAFAAAGLLLSSVAWAQPANDNCASPTAVSLGATAFDNSGATNEGTDPFCAGQFPGNSVWFSFTAGANTAHTVSTCGTSFDTVLGVYTAPSSCGAYAEISCNDDAAALCGPGGNSAVTWCAQSGTTYFFLVFGFKGGAGTGTLTVTNSGTACTIPANDSCGTAQPLIDPFPVTGSQDTRFADSSGDPFINCGFLNQHSVWFTFTPTVTGEALFDTCGSDYDTVVAVFSGTCGSLTEITCNDDTTACGGPTTQSQVTWSVTSGTTYTIEVVSHNTTGGTLAFLLDAIAEEVACRRGNINGGVGPVTDTVFVNNSVGVLPSRQINVAPNTPFTLRIDQAPSGGRRYAMYAWVGQPTAGSVRTLPLGVGRSCMPTPLNPGAPQPRKIANNTGRPQAGTENWPGPPTQPATYTLLSLPGGLGRTGTFFFQGIQLDANAPNGQAGVTNGIVIVSQ